MHILLVEDEPATRPVVDRALGLLGYQVDQAASGEQALTKLASSRYDLMLLDLQVTEGDGEAVMKQVREAQPGLPVIVFTARATLESAIATVRAGAVDYLVKPCSSRVIRAAVERALKQREENLRRERLLGTIIDAVEELGVERQESKPSRTGQAGRFLKCWPVTLDRERDLVTVVSADGTIVHAQLTCAEARLLACLVEQPGTVMPCRQLAWVAFDYDLSGQEACSIIRPHICRLRKKMEPDAADPRLIRVVRGKGYLFSSS